MVNGFAEKNGALDQFKSFMSDLQKPDFNFFNILCAVLNMFKSLSDLILPGENENYNLFLQTLVGNDELFISLYDLYTPDNWEPYGSFYEKVFKQLANILSDVAKNKGKDDLLNIFDDWI